MSLEAKAITFEATRTRKSVLEAKAWPRGLHHCDPIIFHQLSLCQFAMRGWMAPLQHQGVYNWLHNIPAVHGSVVIMTSDFQSGPGSSSSRGTNFEA